MLSPRVRTAWGDVDVTYLNPILGTAEQTDVVDSAGGLGIGAIALLVAVALILIWMGFLFVNSRRSRGSSHEAAPPNLSPHVSDDELENTKLTKVLRASLFGAAILAITLPWYAFNEPTRQADAAVAINDADVEAGAHWFSIDGFQCQNCHGADAGGGSATFVEERSGVEVSWSVPSLDDVLYRYSPEEVQYWIVYGRSNTPMPANGLAGGGAMSVQEVDQTIAYLQSIQLSQADAFGKSGRLTDAALTRIANGATSTQSLINKQEADIAEVEAAQGKLDVVGGFPDEILDLFQSPGTCTDASAAYVGATCSDPGTDTDRDGLTDEVELRLSAIAAASTDTITVITAVPDTSPTEYSFEPDTKYAVSFDPADAFTNTDSEGVPLADFSVAEELNGHLTTEVLLLNVTAERKQLFLENLEPGLTFLQNALETRPWDVDFAAVASDMGVSEDEAKQAVGLFNAYCARCHTGGYSAGPSFEQGAGSGAWGPALWDGRTAIQFPNIEDHLNFIISGSENAVGYGVNGIGTGRMPAFGNLLSKDQLTLIVKYERSL
jgi:mono/diheme cytochrome c family protein